MHWLICEYLLKGVFLGLLTLAALSAAQYEIGRHRVRHDGWRTCRRSCGCGSSAAAGRAQAQRRPFSYLIVLLLESPTCVYAGLVFGLASACWRCDRPMPIPGCFSAASAWAHPRGRPSLASDDSASTVRWLAALLAGCAIVAVVIWLVDRDDLIPEASRRAIGLYLLAGLPFFYLLTLAGTAEESEVEIAALCAVLGVGVWLINLTQGIPLLAIALPAAIYYLYTRHVMPDLRTFKHGTARAELRAHRRISTSARIAAAGHRTRFN